MPDCSTFCPGPRNLGLVQRGHPGETFAMVEEDFKGMANETRALDCASFPLDDGFEDMANEARGHSGITVGPAGEVAGWVRR